MSYFVFFFFFKQKTAYEMRISDWSSDVCSSDLPISADVAGVADRQTVHVRRATQRFDDFKCGGLLTLQTIGVDRVDDRDRRGLADLLDETHAVVEVALDLDHDRAVHDRLREFKSEEHTSELQSLMRISYAVFCLKKKKSKHKIIRMDNKPH